MNHGIEYQNASPDALLAVVTADDVLDTFRRKVEQTAATNGWTVDKAQAVMLRYLYATDPETATTVVAAFAEAALSTRWS